MTELASARAVRTLTITRAQAMAYRAQHEGRRVGATNYMVKLAAEPSGEPAGGEPGGGELAGLGESQPREGATGDRSGVSWEFLRACLPTLVQRKLPLQSPGLALGGIRVLMRDLQAFAVKYARKEFGKKRATRAPFRGTLLGIEVALLDLAGKALGMSLAELLGVRRSTVAGHAPAVVPGADEEALRAAVTAQAARFPAIRLRGAADAASSVALLEQVAAMNRDAALPDAAPPDGQGEPGQDEPGESPLWIDMNGALDRRAAVQFLRSIGAGIAAGRLPRQVTVEAPVPARHRYVLPKLQGKARRAARGAELRVLADQGTWNNKTRGRRAMVTFWVGWLVGMPRPRAAYLKPAQVGGVLACYDLAETMATTTSAPQVYLGGMYGASGLTEGMIRNLAMALPGLDAVADSRLGQAPAVEAAPAEAGSAEAAAGAGIGAREPYEQLVGQTAALASAPEAARGQAANVYPEIDYLEPLGPNGAKGHLLEREALVRGMSTIRYNKGSFVAADGIAEPLSFRWSRSPLSSAVSVALCTHKEATRLRLRRAGVPVPRGNTFAEGNFADARVFAERVGYPVVVKPAMGVRGIGVVANIADAGELDAAFKHLTASTLGHSDFIVEQHIPGRDYRIVVVGDQVIAAILREPGSITGDGRRSVGELLIAKNLARRENPHLLGKPINYDDVARYRLEREGLTLESVPEAGRRVQLSGSCSLSQGGDSIDVLDELHPSVREACVEAVRAVPGMAFCGVDFLLEDHTKPIDGQQAGICELNAHAAISNCEYPMYGTPRPVARSLMDECVRRLGLATTERKEHLALRLLVRGRVTGVGYRAWMQRTAQELGLTGWVRNMGKRQVEAVVVGEAAPASAVAALAVAGPKAAAPTDVSTTHVPATQLPAKPYASFEIVSAAPEGFDER